MTLPALATTNQVVARMAVTPDTYGLARIGALVEDASNAVRARAGISFTQATTTDTLFVDDGRIRLPERPVSAVTLVTDTDGHSVPFYWKGTDRVLVAEHLEQVVVTYTHGYATIPPEIVAVVCQIAARAYGVPSERSGITQETTGPFSYTMGGAAAAGGLGMLPAEQEVVDRYRRVGGTIHLGFGHLRGRL